MKGKRKEGRKEQEKEEKTDIKNVDSEKSTTKDKIRQSLFTTPQDNNKTFHIRQAEVFHRIMNGENIILSAPTSFGKSLIIEALVASNDFDNTIEPKFYIYFL